MNSQFDPRIDAYIADSGAFARPILQHLRKLVHAACPEIQEGIKWNCPFFMLHGNICFMAAFKGHCGFGFWPKEIRVRLTRELGKTDEAMGQFGRITSLSDLPKDSVISKYLKEAAKLKEAGKRTRKSKDAGKKTELVVPDDLTAALSKNKKAAATFDAFSPSHRKEYIEWLTEAKRPETRERRLAQTLAWLKLGKSRNADYERP
jgi:uncharacterized protein YdeI (YjbR/CyaY-like superfamily)